jgi:predicted transcriptional regulator
MRCSVFIHIVAVVALWQSALGFAQENVTLEKVYRELKVAEARNEERFIGLDKRFEQIDKRFEQIDKRFEQIDKRLDQVDKRISDLTQFLWILSGIFTAMMVAMMGLLFWDRSTIVEKSVQESVNRVKDGMADKDTNERILAVLRELAKTDSAVADVLRKANVL